MGASGPTAVPAVGGDPQKFLQDDCRVAGTPLVGGGEDGVLIKTHRHCRRRHLVVGGIISRRHGGRGGHGSRRSCRRRRNGSCGRPTSPQRDLGLDLQEVLTKLDDLDSEGLQLVVVGLQQTTAGDCKG